MRDTTAQMRSMEWLQAFQVRGWTLHRRTSPWYLLNVGGWSLSISLAYVKFHSNLQYVRNHRNRLAFVSCSRKSVLWAELSNTAVADDWPTHTHSVLQKKKKKEKWVKNNIHKRCDILKGWRWFSINSSFYTHCLLRHIQNHVRVIKLCRNVGLWCHYLCSHYNSSPKCDSSSCWLAQLIFFSIQLDSIPPKMLPP